MGAGIGQAIGQIGGAVNRLDEEQKQERLRLAGAKAANAQLQYEEDLYSVTESIQKDINSGALDYTKAPEEYQKRVGSVQPPQIDDLDDVGKEVYGKSLERVKFKYSKTIDGLVEVKRKDDAQSQFGTALELLDNKSSRPGTNPDEIGTQAAMFGDNAKKAGLDASVVDKSVMALRERAWTNHAKNAFIAARSDPQKLQQLEGELSNGLYADKFDASTRAAILTSVVSRREQLSEQEQRAFDRREAKAQTALNQLNQLLSTGMPIAPEVMDATARAANGTTLEKEFLKVASDVQEVQRIQRLSPAEQIAYVQKKSEELQRSGARSMADVANLQRLQNTVQNNIKMLREDPLAADTATSGTVHPPLDLGNLTNPANAVALSERVNTLYAMRKRQGAVVSIKPLSDIEAQTLAAQLKTASPQQQAATLGLLKQQIRDPEAYKGAVQQIFKDDVVMLAAGQASAMNLKTSSGRPVSDIILTGRSYLNDKTVLMPKNKSGDGEALLPEFNRVLGNAIPMGSPARDAAYQASRAVYAALSKEDGQIDGTFDADRMKRAIEIGTGGVVDYGGSKTLKPYGMSDDEFADGMQQQVRLRAHQLGLPEKAFDDLPLEYAGNGGYYLRNGLEFVKDKDGRPLVVTPTSQSATGQITLRAQ